MVIRLQGGLGNQMFQYAFAKAFATKKNTELQVDLRYLESRAFKKNFTFRDYDLSIFDVEIKIYKENHELSASQIYWDKILQKLHLVKQQLVANKNQTYVEPHFHYDENAFNQNNQCYFIGYFQSDLYFKEIHHLLIEDFKIKKEYLITYDTTILQRIVNSKSVALHIRRGDFVNHSLHGTMDSDYYINALKLLENKIGKFQLFVFSDDIHWCTQHFNLFSDTTFIPQELAGFKAANHFELMRLCKHFVISNSSFSWWAAFLSENKTKIVIAPKNWFKKSNINTKDVTPDTWIRI